ncbi:hypothetical protein CMV_016375, partial [Castanea mollissima]
MLLSLLVFTIHRNSIIVTKTKRFSSRPRPPQHSFLKIAQAMSLRMVTRKLGSKLLPRFSSTSQLHSHATSF